MIYTIADKNRCTSALHLTAQLETYYEPQDLTSGTSCSASTNYCDTAFTEEWPILTSYCTQRQPPIIAPPEISRMLCKVCTQETSCFAFECIRYSHKNEYIYVITDTRQNHINNNRIFIPFIKLFQYQAP
jgi:hypothetical protein